VTKIYVGNLPFGATEEAVRALFAAHGGGGQLRLETHRVSGGRSGVRLGAMSNADASRAMQALNGADFEGRPLRVNEAQSRPDGGGGRGPRRY